MKKIASTFLIALLLNVAFSANAFAQMNAFKENRLSGQISAPKIRNSQNEKDDSEKRQSKWRFDKKIAGFETTSDPGKVERETTASYQKSRATGKNFSTGTKILIGVGIAAAVVGIVVFAASRDKIKTF
jgi:hypothetical protein